MRIYRHLSELPASLGPAAATIGNFDGVHRGHQWVISKIVDRKRILGLRSLVITFDPHPARAIRPELSPALITPLEQKLDLLADTGVDEVAILPFNGELARMRARQFAREILRDRLNVVELHEGKNFRFGYQAEADIHVLAALGSEFGFTVSAYPPQSFHGCAVSSSRIRSLITSGKVSAAHRLLSRPFSIRSTPATGRGYGTRYTVPTINLSPYDEILPANGVYITQMKVGSPPQSEIFEALTNVGNRPTFGDDSFTVESYLLNFHPLELTEKTPLELCFLHRLRGEKRWPSTEALREQIGRDVLRAKRYFSLLQRMTSPEIGNSYL